MKITQGEDMPADEFRALLDKQPALEARWQQPAGFGRDWPTPEWHELSEAQHAQMFEVERARARRAEAIVDEVRGLIVSGSPFQRRTYLRGVVGEQARWTVELRRILGMGAI